MEIEYKKHSIELTWNKQKRFYITENHRGMGDMIIRNMKKVAGWNDEVKEAMDKKMHIKEYCLKKIEITKEAWQKWWEDFWKKGDQENM